MKLYNIKAHFNLDSSLDDSVLENFTMKYTRYIFRGCGATFKIYSHNKKVTHVTGVKSKTHLRQCKEYIKKTFNIGITQVIIDNKFCSHKDKKVLDMVKIFNEN